MLFICLIVGLYMSIKHAKFIKKLFLWNLRKNSLGWYALEIQIDINVFMI